MKRFGEGQLLEYHRATATTVSSSAFCSSVPLETVNDGSGAWAASSVQEIQMGFLISGCSLAQPWLLWTFTE